jgi:hypothetical protein
MFSHVWAQSIYAISSSLLDFGQILPNVYTLDPMNPIHECMNWAKSLTKTSNGKELGVKTVLAIKS